MPIRRSPNGAHHPHPQAGRDRPEWVVAINRNAWSQSIGIAGRDHPVCAELTDIELNEVAGGIGVIAIGTISGGVKPWSMPLLST